VEDGVSEVPVETSLPKVGEEVNNDMEVANDDTNHGGGNGIDGSIDQGRVDDDPSGYNAEEEAEGDEDDEDEEDQEEEDDEDKEEGGDDLAQNS
jgi:transcriptional activator SPT8